MAENILLNVTTKPVREEVVCYYTRSNGRNITLLRVVERYYDHPQAPGDALIQKIEIDKVKTVKRHSKEAASLKLLESAQHNISTQNLVITNPHDLFMIAICKEKDKWCPDCYKWYITNHAKCAECSWEFTTPVGER